MTKYLFKNTSLLLIIFAILGAQQIHAQSYKFTTDVDGFVAGSNVAIAQVAEPGTDGVLELTPSGINIRIDQPLQIDADTNKFMRLVIKNPTNAVHFRVRADPSTMNTWFLTNITTGDTDFQEYIIDLTSATNWTGTLTGVNFQMRQGQNPIVGDPILIDEITFAASPQLLGVDDVTVKDDKTLALYTTGDQLNINGAANFNKVEIFSILGQQVLVEENSRSLNAINISSLNSGLYILKAYDNVGGVSTKRFAK